MKRFLTALAATTMLATAALAQAPAPASPGQPAPHHAAQHGGPRGEFHAYRKAMDEVLTPEQKAKLEAARSDMRKAHDAVMASLTPDQKAKLDAARKPMHDRMEQRRADFEKILTPEQKAELDKARGGKTREQMTSAERDTFRAAMKKVMDGLTPDQKEKLRALHKDGHGRG
ncbi:hypothetical protein GCM10011497_24340 [Elstera cyanobacteriorum]|uniref:LTXXQ motif family protein n=1 Tax=Elstera cyanobacteriorum TaxID=2022747 RepID=A0A255XKB8_9PROT|nr:hypothetical protein [Elstera cyanobacteriorum]OYQ17378.1 hypothetical protein CHR90_15575 [Elstera cyanobacteriorum]GFZ93385.1 hypothetical protein GCM10011497_24340 [Elstera cyanobacteriorum]